MHATCVVNPIVDARRGARCKLSIEEASGLGLKCFLLSQLSHGHLEPPALITAQPARLLRLRGVGILD